MILENIQHKSSKVQAKRYLNFALKSKDITTLHALSPCAPWYARFAVRNIIYVATMKQFLTGKTPRWPEPRPLDNPLQLPGITECLVDELQRWDFLARCWIFCLLEKHKPILNLPFRVFLQPIVLHSAKHGKSTHSRKECFLFLPLSKNKFLEEKQWLVCWVCFASCSPSNSSNQSRLGLGTELAKLAHWIGQAWKPHKVIKR